MNSRYNLQKKGQIRSGARFILQKKGQIRSGARFLLQKKGQIRFQIASLRGTKQSKILELLRITKLLCTFVTHFNSKKI
jgi:hypothetical protein